MVALEDARGCWKQAAAWIEAVSLNRCHVQFGVVRAVRPPRPIETYRASGGKGGWPHNSQALAADVLSGLTETARRRVRKDGGKVLLATPEGFVPHTWHVPNGGVAVGAKMWVRRYSVAPVSAPLGTVVHELGHLLFDWPDLTWERRFAQECLMARGASGERALDPAPPCAPLLVEAGWRDPVPLTRGLTVGSLGPERVGAMEWGRWSVLVEIRDHGGGARLLMYCQPREDRQASPRICARIPLTGSDLARSVLGLLAVHLRRLDGRNT